MNFQEATAELDRRNKLPVTQFCPLINGLCRKSCVCCQKPHILGEGELHSVHDGSCLNAMLFNKESVI